MNMQVVKRVVSTVCKRGLRGLNHSLQSTCKIQQGPYCTGWQIRWISARHQTHCNNSYRKHTKARKLQVKHDKNRKDKINFQMRDTEDDKYGSILKVINKEERRMLEITWKNGEKMLFPYIFLRDSCQCSKCFHPFTKARLILMRDLKVDAVPINVQVRNNASTMNILWDDEHESTFTFAWLIEHSFTEEARERQANRMFRKSTTWGAELTNNYPTAEYEQLLSKDEALYQWLTDIEEYGLVIIKNAPCREGVLKEFTKHVSFPRSTHYGELFEVFVSSTPSNLAYTAGTLGLHTDIPYDRHPPGVQFLHCIIQTQCSGGENEFADSFYAAEILKRDYPEYYKLLTEDPISFIDIGTDKFGDFYKLSLHPTFSRDIEGNITAIQNANQSRDYFMKLPVEKVDPMLRALKTLDDILYRNHIRIKLAEGDIASFGNRRVLHGRAAYTIDPESSRQRHLQGTYIDLDEINSKRRVLKQKLGFSLDEY